MIYLWYVVYLAVDYTQHILLANSRSLQSPQLDLWKLLVDSVSVGAGKSLRHKMVVQNPTRHNGTYKTVYLGCLNIADQHPKVAILGFSGRPILNALKQRS